MTNLSFQPYPLPTPNALAMYITAGPDGNLWFTEYNGRNIGRITTAGVINEYPVPSPFYPYDITAGPDGNIWYTYDGGCFTVGRITPDGVIDEFPLSWPPQPEPYCSPIMLNKCHITAGPDGNLWVTDEHYDSIGRVTTSGSVTWYQTPTTCSGVQGITTGPDGNLWFTEGRANRIGQITTAGVITEFSGLVQAPNPLLTTWPHRITTGPDNNLWATEFEFFNIAQINPQNGVITEFTADPLQVVTTRDITAGPDGNLWFTDALNGGIGIITPTGSVTWYPTPPGFRAYGIATGSDGNLWVTDPPGSGDNTIWRISGITPHRVGYDPLWLAVTLIGLLVVGAYLLRRRMTAQ